MKYILNETPLKTTNNYKINNIELDLDIDNNLDNLNYKTNSYDKEKIDISSSLKNDFNSKIGLNLDNYYLLNIDVKDNIEIEEPLIIMFDIEKTLIEEININVGNNSKIDIIFKYISNNKTFNHLKQITNLKENSKCNISVINLLNKESTSMIAVENNLSDNSYLDYNIIDLGGNTRISNYYSKLNGINSINNLNSIYLGNNDDRIDINYYIENIKEFTNSNIVVEGALNDNSFKSFKGTINFISGCKKSIGNEVENCILLSDSAKSKSLPMLLCTEEDVQGAHGVSTGKIDDEKLFYLESKGISKKEAINLIIKANFNKVLKNIPSESILDEVNEYINSRINQW